MRLYRILVGVSVALLAAITAGAAVPDHFDAKGKLPSESTVKYQQEQRVALPFDDERDFVEMRKGFIAAPDFRQIMADAGNVAWDMGKYDFLLEEGQDYDSINPSLQRQALLNMNYGLYEVMEIGRAHV